MSNNFNVTAALNKNGTISCSWSGVAGADSYQVRICDFGSKVNFVQDLKRYNLFLLCCTPCRQTICHSLLHRLRD